ncbi:hypothetical protein [Nocardia tengchongensis]|uniref:hypothetical protein n=1 Tax=Nocardia tengchongensis TaxID=2055889 RepID=UPI003696CDF0
MVRKQWKDLNPRTRGLIVGAGVIDGIAKIAALLDLLQRPPEQIRGSKRVWAISIVLVNSIGALPVAYFLLGRRAPVGVVPA